MALQHCLEDKLNILFLFFLRLKMYQSIITDQYFTVSYSAFKPNKEARDINVIPGPNLTIKELKIVKDNAE